MPLAFGTLLAISHLLSPQGAKPPSSKPPQSKIVEIVVHSIREHDDLQAKKFVYDESVIATFDVTTIYADHLEIDYINKRLRAKGHIRVVDPDLKMTAENIDFSWLKGQEFGHAEKVDAHLAGAYLIASAVDILPDHYDFFDVQATTSGGHPPIYEVDATKLSIYPGNYGRAENAMIKAGGFRSPRLRVYRFNLDKRVDGLGIPSVSYEKSNGVGIAYAPSFLINHQTNISTNFGASAASIPRYGVQVTHTFVPENVVNQGRITPSSDLDQRFGFGYFDDVLVKSPESEYAYERLIRNSIGIDSEVNQGATERLPGGSITKAVEVVYERGGKVADLGGILHARLQSVREQGQTSFIDRLELDGSLSAPPIPLNRYAETVIRFDGQGFLGDNQYAWVRSETGIAVRPVKQVRLSAAYIAATDFGHPDLTIDQLYTKGGLYFRGDLMLGPTRASYLVKFKENGEVYDNEYEISQAVGCFKISLLSREFPAQYRLSVDLRFDNLQDVLSRRKFIRPQPAPTSPASDSANE
jgi:hypothetical protein